MNSQSAKSGFRTFILTLSVSLIVFSVIYYAISNSNSFENSNTFSNRDNDTAFVVDIEEESSVFGAIKENLDYEGSVLADVDEYGYPIDTTTETTPTTTTTVTTDTPTTVTTTPTTTTTTQATQPAQTPETGVLSVTLGLTISLLMFLLGLFVISKNPRNIALSSFEKKLRDFD